MTWIEVIDQYLPKVFSLPHFISYFPELARGAVVTVRVTLIGYALAVVIGLIVAIIRRSRYKWLKAPVMVYVEIVRNTPILVQLYIYYFVLPTVGIVLPAEPTAIAGLAMHFSAYLSEVYRAGLASVDRGYVEAAIALGMPSSLSMRRIILPLAMRAIIPAMGNYLIGMFKDSAFVAFVAVSELLAITRHIAYNTFRVFEVYTAAAILYLLVSFPAARLVNATERYLKRDLVESQGA